MEREKKLILIADDQKDLNEPLSDKLTSAGFDVLSAYTGQHALLLAFQKKPDLILLDIIMPEVNGIEVLKRIRADEWGKTVKIIALTVMDDKAHRAMAEKAGVEDYLVKSEWKLDDIVERIKQVLNT